MANADATTTSRSDHGGSKNGVTKQPMQAGTVTVRTNDGDINIDGRLTVELSGTAGMSADHPMGNETTRRYSRSPTGS